MIPETMAALTTFDTSVPPLWGDMGDYSIDDLRRAYCASWTSLDWLVRGDGRFEEPQAMIRVPSTVASASLARMYAWLGLQIMTGFSELLFLTLQRTAKKPVLKDTVMEIFTIVLREMNDKMCGSGLEHSRIREAGLLRLQGHDSGEYTTVRHDDTYIGFNAPCPVTYGECKIALASRSWFGSTCSS